MAIVCPNKPGLKETVTISHTVANLGDQQGIRHQILHQWITPDEHISMSGSSQKTLVTRDNDKVFLNTKSISPSLNLCIYYTTNY